MRLLQIVVSSNLDLAVRQVASINFKNFVAKNWSPHDPGMPFWILKYRTMSFRLSNSWFVTAGEPQKISSNAKDIVRENILTYITQVPPLLRYGLCQFFNESCLS